MEKQDLRHNRSGSALLTFAARSNCSCAASEPPAARDSSSREAKLDRLLSMMARWWDGCVVARIARESGMTRQRAAYLLAEVGCTRGRWCRADHQRADSRRRALPAAVREARVALLHPLAHRLTVRQRAALAWRAMGLASPDVARRMLNTPQNVRHFQVAAYRRLKRLERVRHEEPECDRQRARYANVETSENRSGIGIDWRELLTGVNHTSHHGDLATEETPRQSGQGV